MHIRSKRQALYFHTAHWTRADSGVDYTVTDAALTRYR